MKKLFTALMCAAMVFGIGGCGNGNKILTDSKEIYEKLKEKGFEVKLDYLGDTGNDNGTFYINILNDKDYILKYTLLPEDTGYFEISEKKNKENSYIVLTAEEVTENVHVEDCYINAISKEENKNSKCTATTKSDAMDLADKINSHFSDMNLSPKGLNDFCKWYIEENGDNKKAQEKKESNSSNGIESNEDILENLGYVYSDGAYMNTNEIQIGDTVSKLTVVTLEEKYFGFSIDGTENGLIVVDYGNQTVSFMTDSGLSIYDHENKEWVDNPPKDNKYLNMAENYYIDFLSYLNVTDLDL